MPVLQASVVDLLSLPSTPPPPHPRDVSVQTYGALSDTEVEVKDRLTSRLWGWSRGGQYSKVTGLLHSWMLSAFMDAFCVHGCLWMLSAFMGVYGCFLRSWMLSAFMDAFCVHGCFLRLWMLSVFMDAFCVHGCLWMLSVCMDAFCVHGCFLHSWMLSVFMGVYRCFLRLWMLSAFMSVYGCFLRSWMLSASMLQDTEPNDFLNSFIRARGRINSPE